MSKGFTMLPSLLFSGQAQLKLNPMEFNVLTQIVSFWWESGRLPFPSLKRLSERVGVSTKTVQRAIAALEGRGLLRRHARTDAARGRQANAYDLSGLISALELMAIEADAGAKRPGTKVRRRRN